MMSKVVGFVLILAIPGFVGYSVPLNEDVKKKRSRAMSDDAVSVDIWSAPSASIVASQRSRWPITATQNAKLRLIDGDLLTRHLQRELRRVGCYPGVINGVWTAATQQAMKTFTKRINATLPTQQPDHILLAIIQGYPDKTCTMPCPEGESLASEGKCLPRAISGVAINVAPQSHTKPVPLITSWFATVTSEDD